DLQRVLFEVCSLRTYVRCGQRETGWQLSLNAQIPLLNVALGMMIPVHLSDGLNRLRQELLRAQYSQASAGRGRDTLGKGQRNRIVGMSAVDCTGVGRPRSVHHVIDGIESERDVTGYPEDAIAAAHNHLRR